MIREGFQEEGTSWLRPEGSAGFDQATGGMEVMQEEAEAGKKQRVCKTPGVTEDTGYLKT